jgi:3-oxosteroid 1-dehydrogenase
MSDGPDVAVVGSGGAGLVAALSAAVRGARVAVFDRAPVLGGTMAMSGGGMWLPNNALLAATGKSDSSSAVEAYLRKVTLGLIPEEMLQAFTEFAPTACDFLREHLPVEFMCTDMPDYHADFPGALDGGRTVSTGLYETSRLGERKSLLRPLPPSGSPPLRHDEQMAGAWGIGAGENVSEMESLVVERKANGIAGRGNALAAALIDACSAHGVEFSVSTRVQRLYADDGRVTGLGVVRDGVEERVSARAVVLAAGGFEWDRKLWDSFVGVPMDGPASPPFNEGDGLKMAYGAGAQLRNLQNAWWCPAVRVPGDAIDGVATQRLFAFSKGFPGAIAVNRYGRRFANEAMNYNDFGYAMSAFDSHTYEFSNLPTWIVMDEEHVRAYGIAEKQFGDGWLKSADTIADLAAEIGVEDKGLQAQIDEFNASAADGKDPVFRRGESAWETYRADPLYRNPTVRPLKGDRYYAYRQTLATLGTNGGAVIDERARVVDLAGHPIDGLFAAGNTAASIFGRAYPGGGATLGQAVTFGYLAGLTATQ